MANYQTDIALLKNDLTHMKEVIHTAIETRDKAINVAATSIEARLSGMNEFRDQLRDQASRFITREEHNVLIDLINKVEKNTAALIGENAEKIASLQGKFYIGGTGVVIMITILQLILNLWHH